MRSFEKFDFVRKKFGLWIEWMRFQMYEVGLLVKMKKKDKLCSSGCKEFYFGNNRVRMRIEGAGDVNSEKWLVEN